MNQPPRRRRSSTGLVLVGLLLLAVAAVGVAYPLWWQHRASAGARHLLHEPLVTTPTATHSTGSVSRGSGCKASLPSAQSSSTHLAGILQIPSLGLRAPVLQGVADTVLNVAVGHDPATPWPGGIGESLVLAHDVSYFAKIDQLKAGTAILWRDACSEEVFRVTSALVTTPGKVIDPPPVGKGLALVTCYPTNALFWTPDRYVVEAAFVSSRTTATKAAAPQVVTHLVVPAPPGLVAEGLTLQDNPIPLGRLAVTGSPSSSWTQGPAPLDVEADALESFFGAEKAIAQQRPAFWTPLAVRGLALPRAWANTSDLDVSIGVDGTSVRSVVLHSATVTMTLVVDRGELLIASVSRA